MRPVALILFLASALPAAAQDGSVTVYGGGEGQTLIDPGTGQTRYVPPLLQPWENGVIHLRPPGARHRAAAAAPAPAHPHRQHTAAAPPLPAPAPVRPHRQHAAVPVRQAAAPPAPAQPAGRTLPNGFGDVDLINGNGSAAPAPARPAPAPARPAPAHPAQVASVEPPRPHAPAGTLKQTVIFSANATDPSTSSVTDIRSLAGSLAGALGQGSARLQLYAYAGARGVKSSDNRRLSLKRALIVRQLLIDDGIAADRIDVFALGGADDSGALDRVDVYLKS